MDRPAPPASLCMSRDDGFIELIRRVRAGDEAASAELVRLYEPAIRVAIRARLTDPRLRRLLDSTDVCQSVLGNFFGRATSGQFEIKDPKQLVALLVTMARNRITNHALQQQAACRDHRRGGSLAEGAEEAVDPSPGPGSAVEGRDLVEAVRVRMTDEERLIADQWASGNAWDEIGAKIGARPDTLRIRLGRAFDRVRRELGRLK
jgi:DNA-directed RNA polymerase specialized sigma24 family protein